MAPQGPSAWQRAAVPTGWLPILLQLLVSVVFVLAESVPAKADCPECAFGAWTCPSTRCEETDVLQSLETNFTHQAVGCMEEFPADKRTLNVDIDVYCLIGSTDELTCNNMHSFFFSGISILDGCMPKSTMAENLVREECSWKCVAERPVTRCSWSFDSDGYFSAIGGGLEKCWLTSVCRDGYVEVDVACRPSELWHKANNMAAELERARTELETVRRKHLEAKENYHAALGTDSSASPDEVKAAWARKNETEDALEEVMEKLGKTLDPMGLALNGTNTTADGGFLKQQVSQQLSALIGELDQALVLVEATSKAHDVTKKDLKNAKTTLDDVSSDLEATKQTVTALNETRGKLISDLENSKNRLKQAGIAHEEKRKALDSERTVFMGSLIASVVVLLLAVGTAAVCLLRFRQRWKSAVVSAQLGSNTVAANGGLMVVGRPVDGSGGGDVAVPVAPEKGAGLPANVIGGFSSSPVKGAKGGGVTSSPKTAW